MHCHLLCYTILYYAILTILYYTIMSYHIISSNIMRSVAAEGRHGRSGRIIIILYIYSHCRFRFLGFDLLFVYFGCIALLIDYMFCRPSGSIVVCVCLLTCVVYMHRSYPRPAARRDYSGRCRELWTRRSWSHQPSEGESRKGIQPLNHFKVTFRSLLSDLNKRQPFVCSPFAVPLFRASDRAQPSGFNAHC